MSALLKPGDKVVLATFGTYGDIIPFVAVAKRLQERGVRAVVATSTYYQPFVERHGAEFHALPPTPEDLQQDLGMDVPEVVARSIGKVDGVRFAATNVVLPYLKETYQALEHACSDAKLLISHSYMFAAPLLARRTGIEWRSVVLQPLAFLSAHDPAVLTDLLPVHLLQPRLGPDRYGRLLGLVKAVMRPWFKPVDRLRAELGLPPSKCHPLFEAQFAPGGVFAMYDPALQGSRQDLPENTVFVGSAHSDGTDCRLPEEVNQFLAAGQPPVAFTLGTSAVHSPGRFYELASRAAEDLGVRALFLSGDYQFKRPLPPGQLAVKAASHRALFHRCSAVVHQGGMGTCFQTMRAGVPQLIVPRGNDQPDNAARLQRLGVALSMRAWLPTERNMRAKLGQLLQDDRMRMAANSLADRLQRADGAEVIARTLTGM